MTIYGSQPENRNYLSPLNFSFKILNKPNVNYWIQRANLAGISTPSTQEPNPFVNIPKSGEHINFENLTITFKVDEDLQNYLEIYNWLKGLGKPEYFNQYKQLESQPNYSGNGLVSDISLIILKGSKDPNYEVIYKDAFPISLSGLNFDTTDTDVEFISASASFRYVYHDINKIT